MTRVLAALVALFPAMLFADTTVRTIEYKDGAVALEGIHAFDTAGPSKRPSLLIAVDGAGNGQLARLRGQQYAKMGYNVLVADLFGKGIAPKDNADAVERLELGGTDRKLVQKRMQSAYNLLSRQPQTDSKKIAAIGYGVGGTALLELARTGADLEATVVVHGGVGTVRDSSSKKISCPVLWIIGSEDALATPRKLESFEEEMRGGGVNWQVLRIGGIGSDFTNPSAVRKKGEGYDSTADKQAHVAIRTLLADKLAISAESSAKPEPNAAPKGVPDKAMKVLAYVDENKEAMAGYEGGRTFGNFEKRLPQNDAQGKKILYREWDINPKKQGVNRGPERIVTGSDGSAYFTDDHYETFKKIR